MWDYIRCRQHLTPTNRQRETAGSKAETASGGIGWMLLCSEAALKIRILINGVPPGPIEGGREGADHRSRGRRSQSPSAPAPNVELLENPVQYFLSQLDPLQRSAKVSAPGLVNFIAAVAYHTAPACLKHSCNLVHELQPISVWPSTKEHKCLFLLLARWLLTRVAGRP